jgi:hypothetical protein
MTRSKPATKSGLLREKSTRPPTSRLVRAVPPGWWRPGEHAGQQTTGAAAANCRTALLARGGRSTARPVGRRCGCWRPAGKASGRQREAATLSTTAGIAPEGGSGKKELWSPRALRAPQGWVRPPSSRTRKRPRWRASSARWWTDRASHACPRRKKRASRVRFVRAGHSSPGWVRPVPCEEVFLSTEVLGEEGEM